MAISRPKSSLLLPLLCSALHLHTALSFNLAVNQPEISRSTLKMSAEPNSNNLTSRRNVFAKSAVFTVSSLMVASSINPNPALAATKPPTTDDLDRIKKGYKGIKYLLAHWERETTICRDNGGECKRAAEPVRRYMGLRSTTDPLFQIDKVFDKVKYMDIDPDKLEPFYAATEDWSSAVNMSNSMAFISQFGEFNPGGGKEEVEKYLEESKKQVLMAEKSLGTIIDLLEIQ